MPAGKGILLCGVAAGINGIESTPVAVVLAKITSLMGMGAERIAVPNTHNDLTNFWNEVLLSCVKTLKPFRVGIVHDTNSSQWKTWIGQKLTQMTITWAVEVGSSTGGTISFMAGVTDYVFGSSDIQQRINADITITPSGEPTITAGTTP